MTNHTGRKHARLAPSAAERWWECPGSIRASQGIPETSSIYADEGTAAHELAHHCSLTGFDADRFSGMFVNLDAVDIPGRFLAVPAGNRSFEVTDEMADGVQQYLDFVREIENANGAEPSYEQFVDLSWMGVPGLDGGTADFLCYNEHTLTLDLVDFKYGRGIVVEPEENKQLLCYALGAARRYLNRGLARVRLTVVQPRAPHPYGSIRTWEAEPLDIYDFEDDVRKRALATQELDAPLKPGEWCKFCPAGAICTVRSDHILALAQAEFDISGDMHLPVIDDMPGDRLATLLRYATHIEDWCQRVKEHAHAEAIQGRLPPGFKLVAKRAMRKWRDEGTATLWLVGVGKMALDDLRTTKMKSPAQIESLLPGKNKQARAALIAPLVVQESTGTVLALVEDPRPAIKSDASEFEAVETE